MMNSTDRGILEEVYIRNVFKVRSFFESVRLLTRAARQYEI